MIFTLISIAAVAWIVSITLGAAWIVDRFLLPRHLKNFDADAAALR